MADNDLTSFHKEFKICFVNKNHLYHVYDKDDKKNSKLKYSPIGVTTLIHKYQIPFDVEKMSLLCSKKEGVSQDEIKKRWQKINEKARSHGTKMHNTIEKLFKTTNESEIDSSKFTDEQKTVFSQIKTVVNKLKSKPFDYETEKIVFDPKINLAGTIDLVAKNRENGDYVIIDWKTNNRIRTQNEYGQYLLSPVDELQDCEFSIYALQLSMYERILRESNYVDDGCNIRKFICHFHPISGISFKEIDSSYGKYADAIINDHMHKKMLAEKMNSDIPPLV